MDSILGHRKWVGALSAVVPKAWVAERASGRFILSTSSRFLSSRLHLTRTFPISADAQLGDELILSLYLFWAQQQPPWLGSRGKSAFIQAQDTGNGRGQAGEEDVLSLLPSAVPQEPLRTELARCERAFTLALLGEPLIARHQEMCKMEVRCFPRGLSSQAPSGNAFSLTTALSAFLSWPLTSPQVLLLLPLVDFLLNNWCTFPGQPLTLSCPRLSLFRSLLLSSCASAGLRATALFLQPRFVES